MIWDISKYSLANIWHRKTRSFLTMLSILIGISAIFALSSFGLGLQLFVQDFSRQMGTDKLMIMPRDYLSAMAETKVRLNDEDLDFIKGIKGVDEATGNILAIGKLKYKDYKEVYPFAIGFPTDSAGIQLTEEIFSTIKLLVGRSLKKGDMMKIVLGYRYSLPNNMFKKAVSVGDTVTLNDVPLKVVGIYEEIGNSQDDSQVYLSNDAMKEIFGTDNYYYLLVRSSPGTDPTDLAEKITDKFRRFRDQKEGQEDFFVQTFEQLLETYSSVLNVLVGVLVLIALISIVVAAVNITNTMYTSILERTKEIGIMKSIGATNGQISYVFLLESGLFGLFGGIFGVLLGYVFARIGGYFAAYYGVALLKPYFPWWLIAFCITFALLLGLMAGFFPARQAAKLPPVDALRYE